MKIKAKILADMKEAVENGDSVRRSVTRMLLSELNYVESALPPQAEIDDVSSQQVINNYYKKLVKTVSNYSDPMQCQSLQQEIAIVEQYLPRKSPSLLSQRTLLEA